jgi:hypothetical protein
MTICQRLPRFLACFVFAVSSLAASNLAARATGPVPTDQVKALARDAYFYAFPIVLMDITMRQATNVPNATAIPMRAPINQFAHFRSYLKAEMIPGLWMCL